MAPASRPGKPVPEDDLYGIKGDRKTRKPLVEKKRRARINESLQELRALLSDTDLQSKMENAEVLEMTVKRVEHVLHNRAEEADALSREASERFAAGYIQCMHEVHTYVSTCPGIDATVAAELLNHLLECMPLNEEHFQDVLADLLSEPAVPVPGSPGGHSVASARSSTSLEDLCSDLDETDAEHSISSPAEVQNGPTAAYIRSMWRPW